MSLEVQNGPAGMAYNEVPRQQAWPIVRRHTILASLRREHYGGYDSENKDQPLPLQKIRLCYFFRAVYHSKNHVIPYCLIAGILNTTLKNNNSTLVKFSKYN